MKIRKMIDNIFSHNEIVSLWSEDKNNKQRLI